MSRKMFSKFSKKSSFIKAGTRLSESSDEHLTQKKGEGPSPKLDVRYGSGSKDKKRDLLSLLRLKKKAQDKGTSSSSSMLSADDRARPQKGRTNAHDAQEVVIPAKKDEKDGSLDWQSSTSPGVGQFADICAMSTEKQEADNVSSTFLTPLWSFVSRGGMVASTCSHPASCPQTQDMIAQMTDSGEGSSKSSTVVEDSHSDVEDDHQGKEPLKSEKDKKEERSTLSLPAWEEVGWGKLDTSLGNLSIQGGAFEQKVQLATSKSSSYDTELKQLQLPLKQTSTISKQEVRVDQETLLPRRVRVARQRRRASATNIHPQGPPPRLAPDVRSSTDVSDIVKSWHRKHKEPEEMEIGERSDEFSLSSDTDFSCIDHEKAPQILERLHSENLDVKSMVKLQSIFSEYRQYFEKARRFHHSLKAKITDLKLEKVEMKRSRQEACNKVSEMERDHAAMLSENEDLKFQLKQEQESCDTANMLHNDTKERLRRMEEQQKLEEQEKQKVMSHLIATRNRERELLHKIAILDEQLKCMESTTKSSHFRLAEAEREAALCQVLRENLQRERKERQHLKDETCSQYENISSLSLKLDKAEAQANSLGNEVQRMELQLTEKILTLDTLQQDSHQIHSRLSSQVAKLEKDNKEMNTQMEFIEKKARKLEELKNSLEVQLDQKMSRNTELKEDMHRSLKTAKKKLVKETFVRSQLVKANKDLNDQLVTLKSLKDNNEELQRSKRELEQEVIKLKRRIETFPDEQSRLEQCCQQKMQQTRRQVDFFLQSEAASRETRDQIQTSHMSNLKENIYRLEGQLGQAHSAGLELERYKQLYSKERVQRQELAAKLDRMFPVYCGPNTYSWDGGKLLPHSPNYKEMVVNGQDYVENGHDVCEERFDV